LETPYDDAHDKGRCHVHAAFQPKSLSGFDGEQPAGPYSVETDEELLDGVSFPAYRRTETRMYREDVSTGIYGVLQIAVIDPKQLEAALAVEAAHT
jgi:hypothetical protein